MQDTRKSRVFLSKVLSYLAAFNFMAIVYPVSGCIREFSRFGIADTQIFLYNVGKAIFYSVFLNSGFFLSPYLSAAVSEALGLLLPSQQS